MPIVLTVNVCIVNMLYVHVLVLCRVLYTIVSDNRVGFPAFLENSVTLHLDYSIIDLKSKKLINNERILERKDSRLVTHDAANKGRVEQSIKK